MNKTRKAASRIFFLSVGLLVVMTACSDTESDHGQTVINPGPIEGESIFIEDSRGGVWCEIIPLVGTLPDVTAQLYTSASVDHCTEERAAEVDLDKLAAELDVDRVVINPGRYWVMDRVTAYQAGETVELGGVTVKWAATLSADSIRAIMGPAYSVAEIWRDTEWLFRKGNPVYLLRAPDDKVWVLQVITKDHDPTLTVDTLDTLADKLELPEGWTFEIKVLEEDLFLEPRRAEGIAYIMRDNLGNTYQGCGFDAACSYIP